METNAKKLTKTHEHKILNTNKYPNKNYHADYKNTYTKYKQHQKKTNHPTSI